MKLHSEAKQLTYKEIDSIMGPGGKELVDHIGEKETIIYVLYKNDQTGLFCHHIPNVLYMHND